MQSIQESKMKAITQRIEELKELRKAKKGYYDEIKIIDARIKELEWVLENISK